ncbi:hypothetical protein [Zoogloea sp.]|uniref:hypothetical protein n=1 Tax=Zoogloea sp. TaxID=49181 RepID=UPI00258B8815|nr:hypothetical protein [Zoogloea sp.]MDD2669120.1 hypothetical protein [Zoogloea sp.]
MHRILAILLMLLVPLQFAWAAAESVDGHWGEDVVALGFHVHDTDHDHQHESDPDSDHDGLFGLNQIPDHGDHGEDGHHDGGHYHPLFSTLIINPDLNLGDPPPGVRPVWPPAAFTSHIPPLFDWPPSVLL